MHWESHGEQRPEGSGRPALAAHCDKAKLRLQPLGPLTTRQVSICTRGLTWGENKAWGAERWQQD